MGSEAIKGSEPLKLGFKGSDPLIVWSVRSLTPYGSNGRDDKKARSGIAPDLLPVPPQTRQRRDE